MKIVELKEDAKSEWDKLISVFSSSHPLSSYGWGMVRSVDGWNPSFLVALDDDGATRGGMMIFIKRIPWTKFTIMYAPKGPVCDPHDHVTIKLLSTYIKSWAKRGRPLFIRIDPNFHEETYANNPDPFIEQGFIHLPHRWSFWNSPRDVYRINIEGKTEEDLLKSFHKSVRKGLNKANREGVVINEAESIEDLQNFYHLFAEFSVKKKFICRQYLYQKSLWDEFISRGMGCLFLATYQDKIIGGKICIASHRGCLAMHTFTMIEFQHLRTSEALSWAAIKWARNKGCEWYSFRGVGTTPTQESFKSKFGPEVYPLVGYYDLPLRPIFYKVFYFFEFQILPRVWKYLMMIRKALKFSSTKSF